MSDPLSRRRFAAATAGFACAAASDLDAGGDEAKPKTTEASGGTPNAAPAIGAAGPTEAAFARDYPAPGFKPSWKRPQISRLLVQDFVIYAHSDLTMTKQLLTKERGLINATMDWGAGDWETGLGGASHMGRRDLVEFLLSQGARIDIFCAAMLGQLDAVKSFLTLQPALIDARGPHGFTLHFPPRSAVRRPPTCSITCSRSRSWSLSRCRS